MRRRRKKKEEQQKEEEGRESLVFRVSLTDRKQLCSLE